ncbi:sensor histidine kinase [Paenibacillus agilis]|uniref:histidine kinase n=1 Tax=Paenibacillus agilis TaxID=3020863 RepID=A0A559J1E1_9BACL|nr:ATP-binding protein [Paenibacillus agilis]TVX93702.1 HAMP domain-containing protein [Paenibacillus agilis]
MKKRGITFKLFALTSAIFVLFYALLTAGLFIFFEQFYEKHNIKTVKDSLYSYIKESYEEETDEAQYVLKNDALLAILEPDGSNIYTNPFVLEVLVENKGSYMVPLFMFYNNKELLEAGVKTGDSITLTGLLGENATISKKMNSRLFYPYIISYKDNVITGGPEEKVDTNGMTQLSGVITGIQYPDQPFIDAPYDERNEIIAEAIDRLFPLTDAQLSLLGTGESMEVTWLDSKTGADHLIEIQPILQHGNLNELIFSVSAHQEIGESFDALKTYYIYIGIGGFVVIILLSFMFSKIVSQPILKMNHVASRMARLDFSAVSEVKSYDEMGSLSESLNSLSNNLQRSMNELQDANEQLQKDMEHKQKMEQLQKEFIANASHELKTPLSIVKSYAEGLLDDVVAHKRTRYTEVILDEAGKMETLVNDMLELAKLDSPVTRLKLESFSLIDLLQEIIDKLTKHLREKHLHVIIHTHDEAEQAWADSKRIEQVLTNILVNAIRHSDTSSTISVTLKPEQVDGSQHVHVRIDNHGEHIPEEQLAFIWDRFYRGEQSRNRKMGGTGLGLAITKHILDLHGSRYHVFNTEQGVAFAFTVPAEHKDDNTSQLMIRDGNM